MARAKDKPSAMRADPTAQIGGAGLHRVIADFDDIGWGPIPVDPEHDLGTDLLIQVRDRRRFDLATLVGAQVKAGDSYFTAPGKVGDTSGWWYGEEHEAHFDLWARHSLPHLLVLHSPATKMSYWVHVRADLITGTGEGAKIFVPSSQVVNADSLDALLEVAVSDRVDRTQQIDPTTVPPSRRVQHALLTPSAFVPDDRFRVADRASPEEFIALAVTDRRHLFKAEWIPPTRRTWMVRFAEAVGLALSVGDSSMVRVLCAEATKWCDRAASAVVLAMSLRDNERHSDIVGLLTPLIESDRMAPEDHAWLLVQRSRALAELGEAQAAHRDASSAVQALSPSRAWDAPANAILRAAQWLLFQSSPQIDHSQVAALRKSTEPIGLWRRRLTTEALTKLVIDSFEKSSDTRGLTFGNTGDAVVSNLFAAEINVDLVGDHQAWRSVAALRARVILGRTPTDEAASQAIDLMRRSGDNRGFERAIRRVQQTGPVAVLETTCRTLKRRSVSGTAAYPTTTLVRQLGAHYLSDHQVPQLLPAYLEAVSARQTVGRTASALRGLHAIELWRATAVLLGVSDSPKQHDQATKQLCKTLADGGGIISEVRQLPDRLRLDLVDSKTLARLAAVCVATRSEFTSEILVRLHRSGTDGVDAEIVERAIEGDAAALDGLDARMSASLQASDRSKIVEHFAQQVERIIGDAESGRFGYGRDWGRALVVTNTRFPEEALWEPVIRLLASHRVDPEHKVGTIRIITELAEKLDQTVLTRVRREAVPTTALFSFFPASAHGALLGFRLALSPNDSDEVAEATELYFGSSDDRAELAALLGRGHAHTLRPLLAALVQDPSPEVNLEAAEAIGRLAATEPAGFFDLLVEQLLRQPSFRIPLEVLRGMNRTGSPLTSRRAQAVLALRAHPSRMMRNSVDMVVEACEISVKPSST